MKRNLLIALALISILFLAGWSRSATHSIAQQWEYHTEYAPSDKKLNELGADGWELVAIGSKGGITAIVMTYVFKRAK